MQLPRSWQIMTRAAYFYVRGAVSNSLNLRVGNLKRSTERGDCKKISLSSVGLHCHVQHLFPVLPSCSYCFAIKCPE